MDGPRGPLRGPGSKGSEGSACLWQAGSKGGGIALTGDEYKVSVTGFTFSVIWLDKHYGNQPPPVAFPPLVPYGTTFPPRSGGTIKL